MSLNRYGKRRDIAEEAVIEALEKCGWHIWQLDRPCDLLLWHPKLGPGVFRMLEVKTGWGKIPKARQDLRQAAQIAFIRTTGTPVVKSAMEALRALGEISE